MRPPDTCRRLPTSIPPVLLIFSSERIYIRRAKLRFCFCAPNFTRFTVFSLADTHELVLAIFGPYKHNNGKRCLVPGACYCIIDISAVFGAILLRKRSCHTWRSYHDLILSSSWSGSRRVILVLTPQSVKLQLSTNTALANFLIFEARLRFGTTSRSVLKSGWRPASGANRRPRE